VAARGNHHLRVLKEVRAKQAFTGVETLDPGARREEIARMLAGTQVTEAARQAALSLLADAEMRIQEMSLQSGKAQTKRAGKAAGKKPLKRIRA
jgi:hypothetical protein